MPQAIIVFSILFLIIVVYWLCTSKKFTQRSTDSENTTRNKNNRSKEISTGFVPILIIDQITQKGMVLDSFEIQNIPESGITISRPGAEEGDIFLSDKSKDASSIGTEGIIIGKDDQGIFGKVYENGHKKNKLYIYEKATNEMIETKQFDISNGTVICMGSQWLKFRIPSMQDVPFFPDESDRAVPKRTNDISTPSKEMSERKNQISDIHFSEENNNSDVHNKPEQSHRKEPQNNSAPSGFSFETVIDENGRFVIKKE